MKGEATIIDMADGVKGHFAIGKLMDTNSIYWEFYNKGEWCSAAEVFNGWQVKWKLKEVTND